MQLRRPHADLLAVLFDFFLTVGFEQGFHTAEMLFLGFWFFAFWVLISYYDILISKIHNFFHLSLKSVHKAVHHICSISPDALSTNELLQSRQYTELSITRGPLSCKVWPNT